MRALLLSPVPRLAVFLGKAIAMSALVLAVAVVVAPLLALFLSAPLFDYVQALVAHTRSAPEWKTGLSPRAGLGLVVAARAWALLDGRDHVRDGHVLQGLLLVHEAQ